MVANVVDDDKTPQRRRNILESRLLNCLSWLSDSQAHLLSYL